ncbi:MAG: MscL family protein [bacterium]|nr:MscL family protein [bacterium]
MRQHVTGFLGFIRERGVAGLAIGFILGGAAQKLVQALMEDIINPLLAIFGGVNKISDWSLGPFMLGDFISVLINFLILCLVVYIVFKMLQLEKLDKPKE